MYDYDNSVQLLPRKSITVVILTKKSYTWAHDYYVYLIYEPQNWTTVEICIEVGKFLPHRNATMPIQYIEYVLVNNNDRLIMLLECVHAMITKWTNFVERKINSSISDDNIINSLVPWWQWWHHCRTAQFANHPLCRIANKSTTQYIT